MTIVTLARCFASVAQHLPRRRGIAPLANRSMAHMSSTGGHIETDMQEKRRADEDRYVREHDKEALKKLSSKVRRTTLGARHARTICTPHQSACPRYL